MPIIIRYPKVRNRVRRVSTTYIWLILHCRRHANEGAIGLQLFETVTSFKNLPFSQAATGCFSSTLSLSRACINMQFINAPSLEPSFVRSGECFMFASNLPGKHQFFPVVNIIFSDMNGKRCIYRQTSVHSEILLQTRFNTA
jgi:hypothetical protein